MPRKYIKDMLNTFGMDEAKLIHTPMGTNGHLDLNTNDALIDQNIY